MKLVYTEQALISINEIIDFLSINHPSTAISKIIETLLAHSETILNNPFMGQPEIYLEHLNLGHRRIIAGNYKIIYRVESETIYIIDFFDTRQDPEKMRG